MCALPWATPWDFFIFFWPWCVGWKVVAAISSNKSVTISFFFIIFWRFLPIFLFFWFLAHFCTFYAPLWSAPHHLWPRFVLSCLLSPTGPWTALQREKIKKSLIKSIGSVTHGLITQRGHKSRNLGHWWWGAPIEGVQNGQNGPKSGFFENGQKNEKKNKKKMKKFPISRLKWVKLYSTQHNLSEKNEKMTWGALNGGR